MFSPLRNRFGIPGVISVIALVFATLGGAYAASNNSSGGSKATASAKAKRGPKGPKGATGPTGPAGSAGLQGPAGATGKDGAAGANGASGSDGQGVTSTIEPPSSDCPKGGAKFVSASPKPTFACNGAVGAKGPAGSPWTAGGTLPSGATETGTWGMGIQGEGGSTGPEFFPISFTLPLEEAPEPVFVPNNKESEPGCPGRGGGSFPSTGEYRPGTPMADPGKLCVYAGPFSETSFEGFRVGVYEGGSWYVEPGVGPSGTVLEISCASKFCSAMGIWAVTAE